MIEMITVEVNLRVRALENDSAEEEQSGADDTDSALLLKLIVFGL